MKKEVSDLKRNPDALIQDNTFYVRKGVPWIFLIVAGAN